VTKREKRACRGCEEQGVMAAPLPIGLNEFAGCHALGFTAWITGLYRIDLRTAPTTHYFAQKARDTTPP